MTTEKFGENAGLVWNALNESGVLSVKALKKVTGIKAEKELYAAFGWLAREDKVSIEEKGAEVYVSLKK